MTMDLDPSSESSTPIMHRVIQQSGAMEGRSDFVSASAAAGIESSEEPSRNTGRTESPGTPYSNFASRYDDPARNIADISKGSVLGKRNASTLEEPWRATDGPIQSALEQMAKPRHQAIEHMVSSDFRRSSMISPMDPVEESTESTLNTSPLSYVHTKFPPTVSPSTRSPRSKMASISRRNTSDTNNDASDEQVLPSLPGFSSFFGKADQGHRPSISRNSSSSFPDLQTLKAPLTIAMLPGTTTRGSRDSGTTSSSTAWSARSSLATGGSTNITAPPSADLTTASLTSVSWNEDQKHHFPWSGDPSNPDPSYGTSQGLGLSHSIPNHGESRWRRSSDIATPSDLAKRPSYANFGAEVEARQSAAKAAAEAEEAWRRQSDNATILSAERRRLMGSSVVKHAAEIASSVGVEIHLPEPKQGVEGKSLPADEALLAARSRLLRYESYPFGSRNMDQDQLTTAVDPSPPYRRQSVFPEKRSEGEWDANVVNLTHSPGASSGAMLQPSSPARKGFAEPQSYTSVSSQRDLQFEEIVRKASVDLVKRSAASSLTGTPVGINRPLSLPLDSQEAGSLSAEPSGLGSEAERANAWEREQRQQAASLGTRKDTIDEPRSSDQHAIPSEALSLSKQGDLPGPARNETTQIPQQEHQAMNVDASHRWPAPSGSAPSKRPMESPIRDTGLPESGFDKSVAGPSRGSPSSRPDVNAGESFSNSLAERQPFNQRPQAGHSPQGPYPYPHFRNSASMNPTKQSPGFVTPYYDSPARSSGRSDLGLTFPSVLRREYQPSPYETTPHALRGTLHVQSTPVHTLHHDRQRIPPQPEQYGRPPLRGSWDGEPGMPYPSQPPIHSRMQNAPTALGLNNATLPGPRYTCEHCGKSFSRPSSLKIHIYSHTGEKPYKCTWPNCTRSFSVQSNLKRHAKVHLENSGQQSATGASSIPRLGEHPHHALPRISEGVATPGSSSSTSYHRDFLTPQTGQPLPPGGTPESYFDVRLQSRYAASHSPAPLNR